MSNVLFFCFRIHFFASIDVINLYNLHKVPSTNIGICIFYCFDLSFKKITKFEPIIQVKQLKVGGGGSL